MSISSEQGEWTLDHSTPIGFEMATQQVSVAAHCWLQADSSLCLNENIKVGESGEASLSVKQFNFDQIKAFVPEATELKGEANADVWAKWDGANSPEVKVSVELPSGQVTQKLISHCKWVGNPSNLTPC